MKQVIAFIKPHQLSPVAMGLREIQELTGLSIGKGQGFGRRTPGALRAASSKMKWRPHVRIEVFCSDQRLKDVLGCIAADADTGLTGDGKIYVTEVVEALRNGERGSSAI